MSSNTGGYFRNQLYSFASNILKVLQADFEKNSSMYLQDLFIRKGHSNWLDIFENQ